MLKTVYETGPLITKFLIFLQLIHYSSLPGKNLFEKIMVPDRLNAVWWALLLIRFPIIWVRESG
jgi:hypothetical protein